MPTVFDLLDDEWRHLRHDRTAARRLADVCRVAAGARTLAEVEDYVRVGSPGDADGVLLALVSRACVEGSAPASDDRPDHAEPGASLARTQDEGIVPTSRTRTQPASSSGRRGGRAVVAGWGTPDAVAARVLLQLLLPGTRNLARRWWALGDPDERAAAAVAAVYDRIRSYPLARRPGRVAANVLMDAARQLRRAVPPAALTVSADPNVDLVITRGVDPSEDDTAPHPALELVELLRDAVDADVIDAADAELIARSRIAGHRVADIARLRGAGARTLWDRRHRAERALITTHPWTWRQETAV